MYAKFIHCRAVAINYKEIITTIRPHKTRSSHLLNNHQEKKHHTIQLMFVCFKHIGGSCGQSTQTCILIVVNEYNATCTKHTQTDIQMDNIVCNITSQDCINYTAAQRKILINLQRKDPVNFNR